MKIPTVNAQSYITVTIRDSQMVKTSKSILSYVLRLLSNVRVASLTITHMRFFSFLGWDISPLIWTSSKKLEKPETKPQLKEGELEKTSILNFHEHEHSYPRTKDQVPSPLATGTYFILLLSKQAYKDTLPIIINKYSTLATIAKLRFAAREGSIQKYIL